MQKNKKVHLIGVGGKGVSALAFILEENGWEVSGSDKEFNEPVRRELRKSKIKVFRNYSSKNIPEDIEVVVVGGKHANFDPEKNEEVKSALERGLKIKSVPEILREISKNTENTVVAGSFGKSTTTSLLAWCLIYAKKDPSFFIGASPVGLKKNAHIGKSKHFILEGDEYPASNWDNTSKFLYLHPKNLILISGEHDHLNFFKTESDYLKPYRKLVESLPKEGLLVASNTGKNVGKIIKHAACKIVTYGLTAKSLWHPKNIIFGPYTIFDLYKGTKKIVTLETELLGKHNIENVIGVAAFLLEKKLITEEELQNAIKKFKGLVGRLDLKSKKSSVLVYEGFGSSYTKAKSVFNALALHYPNKKIVTVFEPHSASWSNKVARAWYKDIFNTSEKVVVLPPPPHRIKGPNQMSLDEIVKEIKKNKSDVFKAESEKEALAILKKILNKNDIVALVSSGSLLGLVKSLPKLVEKKFPK